MGGELKAQLDKMARECSACSDVEIKYYGTVQPEKLPTSIDDAMELIKNFPQMMKKVGDGHGVPLKVGAVGGPGFSKPDQANPV